MGIKRNIKTRASILAFITTLSAVVSLFSPVAVNAASYSGFATHPDESELVEEINDYQTVAALVQCMNIPDADPGDNKITYSQASNAQWFGSQSVLVGILGGDGNKVPCNDLVTSSVTILGYGKAIDLFCAFVPVNKDGVSCDDPGADRANFYPLDFEVEVKSGDGTDKKAEGYRYADAFLKLDRLTRIELGKPAKYYLYRDALVSSSVCSATTSTSGLTESYVVKDIPFIVVGKDGEVTAGSADAAERQAENLPDAWEAQTVDLTVIPVTDKRVGFKTQDLGPVYPVLPLLSTGGSTAVISHGDAGSYLQPDMDATTDELKDAGLYADPKTSYTLPDCAEIAVRMKSAYDGTDGYENWLFDKDVAGATKAAPDESEAAATATTCAISGVGWIVCPVMEFITNITDSIYGIIDDWLSVDVSLLDVDSATHRGWSAMRDIANVGFVIVFLIVIFSQLTGAGISNYGVKKMLPRLVVMAVVINVSFYIAQIAVDISNILGSSLKDFLANTAVFDTANASSWLSSGNTFTDTWVKLAAGQAVVGVAAAAGIGTVAYGGIGLLVMVVLSAVLAVVVTLLILAARQALIIILIVVSPLAFLAMVMPNTKKWYDRWQQMFVALLAIYPMIAVVYGASAMAANILVDTNVILGLAVATIPLFATIPMLKGSLNAVPIAGNLASKFANRASLGGRVKAGYKQAGKNMSNDLRAQALGGSFGKFGRTIASGSARTARRNRDYEHAAAKAQTRYAAEVFGDPASVAASQKFDNEEIEAEMAQLKAGPRSGLEATLNDKNASSHKKAAARRILMETGNFEEQQKALISIDSSSTPMEKLSMNGLYYSTGASKIYGAKLGETAFGAQGAGVGGADGLKVATAETLPKMSGEQLAGLGKDEMAHIRASLAGASPEQRASLEGSVNAIMTSKELSGKLQGGARPEFDKLVDELTKPGASTGGVHAPAPVKQQAGGTINPDVETTVSLHGNDAPARPTQADFEANEAAEFARRQSQGPTPPTA